MTNYQLYKAFTATADAGAQIQIIKAGRIVGVQWSVRADLDADAEGYSVELSLVPIYQSATNDAKGVVSSVGQQTASVNLSSVNTFTPVDFSVGAGQLLYLNAVLETTADVKALCLVAVR